MNKFFNIWIIIFTLIVFPLALAVGLNVDFSLFGFRIPGVEFEYKEMIFGIFAGIIFLLGALKSSKRWSGIRVVKQKHRFIFSTPISKQRKKRVLLYNLIEIVFSLLFGLLFWYFTESAFFLTLVFFIFVMDYVLNTVIGISKNYYRMGLTKKAIVCVDREVIAVYFTGLKKISKHQQTLYFEYVNDLVLHFPTNFIPEDKQEIFLAELKSVVDPNKVYYIGF